MRGLPWFPPARFARTILARGLAIWLGIRLSLTAIVLVGDRIDGVSPRVLLTLSPLGTGLLVGVVATLAWVDAARRGEPVFLANTGVDRTTVLGLGAAPAALGEIVVQLW